MNFHLIDSANTLLHRMELHLKKKEAEHSKQLLLRKLKIEFRVGKHNFNLYCNGLFRNNNEKKN